MNGLNFTQLPFCQPTLQIQWHWKSQTTKILFFLIFCSFFFLAVCLNVEFKNSLKDRSALNF